MYLVSSAFKFNQHISIISLSQWPLGLSRGTAAARMLGLCARIPPAAYMSVSCECYVLLGRSFVQKSPTGCGVSEYDCEASIMRRPLLTRGCRDIKNCIISVVLLGFDEKRIT
jgi:hypothetical protein